MLSPRITEQLRRRGHDAYAIIERADLVGLSDEQVLALGASEDRVVVTLNVADFAALHADWQAQGRSHSGIVYVSTATFPQDRAFLGALVESLDQATRSQDLPSPDETRFLRRQS
jgi:siroheme synthase